MEEETILTIERKVWKPSRTKTLVVSIPDVDFLKEGDEVLISVTADRRLIIRKKE